MSEYFRGYNENKKPENLSSESKKEILVTIKGKESFWVDKPEKRKKREKEKDDPKELEATPADLLQDNHVVKMIKEKLVTKEAEDEKYESRWHRQGKSHKGAGHDPKYKDYTK